MNGTTEELETETSLNGEPQDENDMRRSYPIMLYDGQCLFCNAAVQFVMRFEAQPVLRFAALQSSAGLATASKAGLTIDPYDLDRFGSFVIVDEHGKAFTKMAACLELFRCLGGFWSLLGRLLSLIPKVMGDFLYSVGWKYRGFVLGKREKCIVPTKALKDRTIHQGDHFPIEEE